jgi:ribosomal protein RSM22 (predicted rRNA methylase)
VDKVKGPGVLVADLSRPVRPAGVKGRFDWIVAAHLLNELATGLPAEALLRLVHFWIDEYLADGGAVILVEPALRATSRGLLVLRDGLVAGGLSILAPCLFPGPCPALVRERDFCHHSAPAIVAGRSRVDFSYLVLSRTPAPPVASAEIFRVVSDPMKEKGRLRLFGCGPTGRILLTRLDREHSEANQGFGELSRGDLVRIEGAATTGEGLRIVPDARCVRI